MILLTYRTSCHPCQPAWQQSQRLSGWDKAYPGIRSNTYSEQSPGILKQLSLSSSYGARTAILLNQRVVSYLDGCWTKNRGKTPQIMNFKRVFHYRPSILEYLYFWKHPYWHMAFFSWQWEAILKVGIQTAHRNWEWLKMEPKGTYAYEEHPFIIIWEYDDWCLGAVGYSSNT